MISTKLPAQRMTEQSTATGNQNLHADIISDGVPGSIPSNPISGETMSICSFDIPVFEGWKVGQRNARWMGKKNEPSEAIPIRFHDLRDAKKPTYRQNNRHETAKTTSDGSAIDRASPRRDARNITIRKDLPDFSLGNAPKSLSPKSLFAAVPLAARMVEGPGLPTS